MDPDTLRALGNGSDGYPWKDKLDAHADAWEEDRKNMADEYERVRKRLEALEAENLGLLDAAVKAVERIGELEKWPEDYE